MEPGTLGSPRLSRVSPPQSPRRDPGLSQSKSYKDLSDGQGMATPRFSPRSKVITGGFFGEKQDGHTRTLARGKSESWLTARVDCSSPRGGQKCRSPRDTICRTLDVDCSPGKASGRDDYHDHRIRSPRASSPTFRVSESWMEYSAPEELRTEEVKNELTMPSTNFSSRSRRCHSGRVSDTSGNWQGTGLGNPNPDAQQEAEPLLYNSVNGIPSKGVKCGITKQDQEKAKRRLRLDASEPVPGQTQRRNDFPAHPQSARHQQELNNVDTARTDRALAATQSDASMMHKSSPELVAALRPEVPRRGAEPPRKILVGAQLVDWSYDGKRRIQAIKHQSARDAPLASARASARQALDSRDHRNSDAVREHLYAPHPITRDPLPHGYRPAPSVHHTHCVYTSGASCLPSTMPKDAAYLQTGTNVSRYAPRAPGAFSPNLVRAPLAVASTRMQL